jgi:hypothetical protein
MKTIQLTKGQFAKVDDEDFGYLSAYRWHACRGAKNRSYYARRATHYRGKYFLFLMHRVIAQARPGEVVDHINHDTLDNQKSNLRVGTQALNMLNRHAPSGSSSKYKGVARWGFIWVSHFKGKHIGYFNNDEDAARSYNCRARGEGVDWALLNEIPGLTKEEACRMPMSYHPRINKNRYRGVRKRGRQWEATITVDNKTRVIGYYPTAELAAKAYNEQCDLNGRIDKKNRIEESVGDLLTSI